MEREKKWRTSIILRWMIRRDMPEVLAIEAESFEFPWLEEDFFRHLRQRNTIGMIAEHENVVTGFMVYDLSKRKIQLMNFAVGVEFRREGIGTQMIEQLKGKLFSQRRTRIVLEIRESNLAAQLFFRSSGFRATSVLRNWFDNGEDAYQMEYRLPPEEATPFTPINRIEKWGLWKHAADF